MNYIVTQVKNKDWDDKDSVHLRFASNESSSVVDFLKKQDNLESFFIIELDNLFAPLNTPINIDLLNGSAMNAKEFLKIFDISAKSKKKIK